MERKSQQLAALLIIACLNIGTAANRTTDPVSPVSSRGIDNDDAKYLVFPQGSNVQLVYCLTVASYARSDGVFTFGVTAGVAYELPYRRTSYSDALYHGRRTRRDIYREIERMLDTQGERKFGRDCVLWALCRAGERSRRATAAKLPFLDEILHSIFTYPLDEEFGSPDDVEYVAAYTKPDLCREPRSSPCAHMLF